MSHSMEDVNKPGKIFFIFLNLDGSLRNSDPEVFAYTRWKENHFYSLPSGQAEASINLLAQTSFELAPKAFWRAELISQFFLYSNCSKNITCPSGKLKTEFTSPIAKSTSPGLLDTTFFACCYIYQNKPVGIIVMKIEKRNSFFNQRFRCHYPHILRPLLFCPVKKSTCPGILDRTFSSLGAITGWIMTKNSISNQPFLFCFLLLSSVRYSKNYFTLEHSPALLAKQAELL